MLFGGVVANRAVAPAFVDAVPGPDLMHVTRHFLDERQQGVGKFHIGRIGRRRNIFFHLLGLLDFSGGVPGLMGFSGVIMSRATSTTLKS